MKNKQNRRSHRMCNAVERVRTLANSGTREHSLGFSTDVSDRVGRLTHSTGSN